MLLLNTPRSREQDLQLDPPRPGNQGDPSVKWPSRLPCWARSGKLEPSASQRRVRSPSRCAPHRLAEQKVWYCSSRRWETASAAVHGAGNFVATSATALLAVSRVCARSFSLCTVETYQRPSGRRLTPRSSIASSHAPSRPADGLIRPRESATAPSSPNDKRNTVSDASYSERHTGVLRRRRQPLHEPASVVVRRFQRPQHRRVKVRRASHPAAAKTVGLPL